MFLQLKKVKTLFWEEQKTLFQTSFFNLVFIKVLVLLFKNVLLFL